MEYNLKNNEKQVCMAALSLIVIANIIIKLILKEQVYDVLSIYAFVEGVNYSYLYSENKEKTNLVLGISSFVVFAAVFILFIGSLV